MELMSALMVTGKRILWTSVQVRAADGGFHTQHNIPELLVVADLAAANESARAFVEPFAGKWEIVEVDIVEINVTPSSTNVAADVEASPISDWRYRISGRPR
jgi:hypothetical protein